MEIPNCKICSSPFDAVVRVPLVLPICGHTFCRPCLRLTISGREQLCCPEDNQIHPSSLTIEQLPQNTLILKMITTNKKKKCFEHNKIKEFYCIDCEMEVCSICGLFGNHKNHKITTGGELKDLNKKLIERSQEELLKIADLKKLRNQSSFIDYIGAMTNEKVEEFGVGIMKASEVG